MKTKTSLRRKFASIKHSRWAAYATAGAATALAGANSAEADIIYSGPINRSFQLPAQGGEDNVLANEFYNTLKPRRFLP